MRNNSTSWRKNPQLRPVESKREVWRRGETDILGHDILANRIARLDAEGFRFSCEIDCISGDWILEWGE